MKRSTIAPTTTATRRLVCAGFAAIMAVATAVADSDFSSSSLSTLYIYGNDGNVLATHTKSKSSGTLEGTGLTGTIANGGDHWIVNITGGMLYGSISTAGGLEVKISGTQVGISNSASGKTAVRGGGGVRICGPGMLHIDQMADQTAIYGGSGNVALTLGAVVGVNCFFGTRAVTGTGVRILSSALHVGAPSGTGIYCEEGGLSIGESIVSVVSANAAVEIRKKGALTSTLSAVYLFSSAESAIQSGTDVLSGGSSISVENSVFCALGAKHGIQCTMVGTAMPIAFNNVVGVIAGSDCGIYNSAAIDVSGGSTKLSIAGNVNGDHSGELSPIDILAGDTSSGQAIQMYSPRKSLYYQEAGSLKLFSPGTVALVSATNIVTGGSLAVDHAPSYGDFQTLFTWNGALAAAEFLVGRSLFESDMVYADFDIAQTFSGLLPSSAVLFAADSQKSSTGIRSDVTYVSGGRVSVKASGTGILIGGRNADSGFLRIIGGKVAVDSDMVGIADCEAADGGAPSTQDSAYSIELNGGRLSAKGKLDGILTCGGFWMDGGTFEAAATGGYAAGTISSNPGLRGYALSANNGLYINGGSFQATAGTLRTSPCTFSNHGFADVYPCDLSVPGVDSDSTVVVSSMVPSWYGVDDLYPIASKLRLWLPAGAASLTWNSTTYKANDNGNVMAGNNVFKKGGTTGGGTLPSGLHTETVDGIKWTFTIRDGEAWLGEDSASKNWDWAQIATAVPTDTVGDIVAPSTLGGCVVKGVYWGAFCFCSKITSIVFSDGLESIDLDTFTGCSDLASVTIPASLRAFHSEAFLEGCSSLLNISVSGNSEYFKSIDGLLYDSSGTRLYIVPKGRTGYFEIPNGIKGIYDAFIGCTKITSVRIPNSVEQISDDSFYWCQSLTNFIVEEGNPYFKGIGGILCDSSGRLRIVPPGRIGLLEIPDGVTGIYDALRCPKVTSVKIPNSVEHISNDSFYDCPCLTNIIVEEGNRYFKSIEGCLYYVGSDGDLKLGVIPEGFPAETHVIPDNVSTIYGYAVWRCPHLTSLTIPKSVTRIGDDYGEIGYTSGAFGYCTNLVSFFVEDGNLAYKSVNGCILSKDGSVFVAFPGGNGGAYAVPAGVQRIFTDAFAGCPSLKSVVIPESVTQIDDSTFLGCDNLAKLYLHKRFEGHTDGMGMPEGCSILFFDSTAAFCTIVLDGQHGIGGTASVEAIGGLQMPDITVPTRTGYTFGGYYTEPNGQGTQYYTASGASALNWNMASDTTLYAYWMEIVPLPVYRFYSKAYRGHFFTIDEEEMRTVRDTNPNWKYENVAYRAYPGEAPGTVALYRFYSKGYRGHFFTIDADEAETVKTNPNWKYEGIAYYVYPEEVEGSVPVFRFWSKGYRHHFYTTSEAEKDNLIATNPNWAYEGVAFWALPAENARLAKMSAAKKSRAGDWNDTIGTNGSNDKNDGNDDVGVLSSAFSEVGGVVGPWALATWPDCEPVKPEGVTEIGGLIVETSTEAPDAAELGGANGEAFRDAIPLLLALPDGAWRATLRSAQDGAVADEDAAGVFGFTLPANGTWHWLRVRDAGDDAEATDAFSLWLRAE